MKWKTIRLELASSGEFPRGSAGRAYLIRLPLAENGAIDSAKLDAEPARATVRRYWPSEADMLGHVVRTDAGYAIHLGHNGSATRQLFRFGDEGLKLGDQVVLTELDGRELPFRVAGLQ